MLDLTDKNIKVGIMSMFTELKETMITEVKKGMMTMSHQTENTEEEKEGIKKPNGSSGVEKCNNK